MCRGLFDNDVFIKLAGCGLIDDACQQLRIQESWVLSSLKPQLTHSKRRGKLAQYFATWPDEVRSQVLGFLDHAQKLPPAEDQAFIEYYLTEYRLDVGELQLLEAALRSDDGFLITGDKRFLNQLVTIPELFALALEKLPGRFACLESVLLLLIDRCGFEFVRDRVLPFKEYDGQIKIAFGGGSLKTEEQAREALVYELNRLEGAVRLLHYLP